MTTYEYGVIMGTAIATVDILNARAATGWRMVPGTMQYRGDGGYVTMVEREVGWEQRQAIEAQRISEHGQWETKHGQILADLAMQVREFLQHVVAYIPTPSDWNDHPSQCIKLGGGIETIMGYTVHEVAQLRAVWNVLEEHLSRHQQAMWSNTGPAERK